MSDKKTNALARVKRGYVSMFKDGRGTLGVAEFKDHVPFVPVRIFWITDVPKGGVRGRHAHKAGSQFAMCISGGIKIEAFDGVETEVFSLKQGDYINIVPGIFAEATFLDKYSHLLVLCDRPYEADDYIYDKSLLPLPLSRD